MQEKQGFGLEFLSGGGEMGQLIRSHRWQETPLGAPENWPQGLRTALRILLTTQHPIFVFWGDELICFYNDAYSRSLGPEQHPSMLGQPARTQWPLIWDVIGPQIDQVMSGGGATWHENQKLPIHRHGRIQDIYWTYSYGPIDEQTAPNAVGGVLVICTETTQQVVNEQRMSAERERFAQLFEQAPSFMAVLRGPEHVFELANPAYLELIDGRDVIGKPLSEALPEAVEQGYLKLLDEVYSSGKAFAASGAVFTTKSGVGGAISQRFLDFVYQPILDTDGKVNGVFVEGFDATDRMRAEQALRDADQRKDEFLAMLAHELRNPLAPIRNAAQILARKLVNDRSVQPSITMVQRQVSHLSRLVDDLMDVSRISQGRIELRRENLLLAQAVDQALETIAPMARDKKQHISVDSGFDTLWVNADRARLVQMFVQADRTLDRAQGGLGIGLSVVRKLVEMHGGDVTASSPGLGQGAVFTIRLPRGQPPTDEAVEAQRSRYVKHRILVVDDNVDAADSLSQLLRLEGHVTETAFSSRLALERFESFKPDVVLLDIGLPEMDGYEVAHRLRQQMGSSRVLLVALTGYGQREDRDRAIAAGFDEHLVKPVGFEELQRLLSSFSA
jgi:CheY-like chemotaxis protein